jgi:hypothetical protein
LKSAAIERIVKWRMGRAYDAPLLDWRDLRLNFDHSETLQTDCAGAIKIDGTGLYLCTPLGRRDYNPMKLGRLVDIAEDLFRARGESDQPLFAFAAMQDSRLFQSLEYLGPRTDAVCAQLSFTRTVSPDWRTGTEVILWPLSFSYRHWKLPDETPAAWSRRKPQLFWRGQTTGMSYVLDAEARPVLTAIRRYRRWLAYFLTVEAAEDADAFHFWAPSYQRLQAVSLCRSIPGTDVRFVPMYDADRGPMNVAAKYLGRKILSERLSLADHWAAQQKCKYALSLAGNDIPSSLRTDLLSGCAVLMPRPFWESDWFYGLKPDVHYIPLRADLADLEERLQWCRENDAQCRDIAAAARAFALEHYEPSIEFEVQSRIVRRMMKQRIPPAAP